MRKVIHYCPFCRQRLEFAGACPRPGCLLQARIDAYKASKVPTGREVIEQGDPVLAGILRDTVMATAKRAREDIEVFFEFVMRDFSTREKVKITPHQRVALRFAQDHDRTVNMWPVGGSKTFCSLCLLLFQIGNEPLTRAAVVSASQEQAQKLVQLARDYIEMSAELHLVFPNLRRTQREGEPWTQTALTIDRPPGIKEATVAAYGLGSQSVQGTRLNFVIIDDVLNQDNTMNHEQRMRTIEWVDTSILSRVDPKGKTKVIMTNTPWHPEDIACHTGLSRQGPGWACLQMDVMGDIRVYDDSRDILQAEKLGITFAGWDSPHLRPADNNPKNNACRLVAHDPDPQNQITLWPDRYTDMFIAQKRRELAPHRFNQMYRAMPTSDETSRCKQAYIDACLQKARDLKIENFAYEYTGQYQVYIGLDLAWSPGEENDDTAFFVFEARPEANVILEIDSGQWPITETMEKLFDKVRRFRGAVVRVENNGCFVPGTRVLTRERGYVAIETIQSGDHVWTHKDRWRPVVSIFEGTAQGVHDARVAGGLQVSVTANHWFYLREAVRTSGRCNGHVRPHDEPTWASVGFVDKPTYVKVAVPQWPEMQPELLIDDEVHEINEEDALVLGLYMAEGSCGKSAVQWTFNRTETHLAELVEIFGKRHFPKNKVSRSWGDGTLRVTISSTHLARALQCVGKKQGKCLPFEWLGFPLDIRVAMVRGWLLGNGCACENNKKTNYVTRFFGGTSISRNWMMWARTTMFAAGYRPTVAPTKARHGSKIKGRTIYGGPGFRFALNTEDSWNLQAVMNSEAEEIHWPHISWYGRATNSQTVIDEQGVWSRLRNKPASVHKHEGPVYNVIVEEDESFTVEDMVVHNGQAMFRKFALQRQVDLMIKPHTTEQRAKAHPETGVEGLFVEMSNGAWAFPNSRHGEMHPMMAGFIEDCINYQPSKHTADRLMACYFARAQKIEWQGMGGGGPDADPSAVASSIMSR